MEQNKCCCGEKQTIRSEEQKKSLLNRLKRIEGQVRGIQAMIERDSYCNDILIQSAAVSAAVSVINSTLAIYTAPSGVTFPARTSLA